MKLKVTFDAKHNNYMYVSVSPAILHFWERCHVEAMSNQHYIDIYFNNLQ
jgi:hypothetical protein